MPSKSGESLCLLHIPMLSFVILVLLACRGLGLQYIDLLHRSVDTESFISNWTLSSASSADDSPFDHVELPVEMYSSCKL